MRVRIKFTKTGQLKYIGHLDVMRYFQKVLRRAGVEVIFTEGFSPHMIMSFALPLGVGIESVGEYFDVDVKDGYDLTGLTERLNECTSPFMRVLAAAQVSDKKADKCMTLVEAADYVIEFGSFRKVTVEEESTEKVMPETEGNTEKVIPEAEGSAEKVIPEAEGSAEKVMPETEGSAEKVIPETEGSAEKVMPETEGTDWEDGQETSIAAESGPEMKAAGFRVCEMFEKFLASDSIMTVKKTKSGEKLTDIRPMILSREAEGGKEPEPVCEQASTPASTPAGTPACTPAGTPASTPACTPAGTPACKPACRVRLSAGSRAHLNPALLLDAFAEQYGEAFDFSITRTEMYACTNGKYVPLIGPG